MEGVLAGVQMLAFPINFDQQTNSKLVAEDWKVGLRTRRGPMDEMEVVGRDEIAKIVRRLMGGRIKCFCFGSQNFWQTDKCVVNV
ncbi:hypothetical protein AMTR_s00002p00256110 [Amborella trichopoda]|uniref:Uncharacterized protein n=1 Tax=Amborella trichopoda TaxID=13333 RepID=W1P2Z6_AMBTC|nr:hypothetical protein AMTR_s00002p00256110 [Amborella trichopoda]